MHEFKKSDLVTELGAIDKDITGNLDADDATRFESETRKIQNKVNHVVNSENNLIVLTEQTINHFNV